MFRRLKSPTLMTKIGWGLAVALTALAVIPAEHVVLTIGALLVGVVLAVVIYIATTRARIEKVITIPITNISAQDRVRYRDALESLLNELGRVESVKDDKSGLVLTLRTDRDLATVHRKIKRLLGKPIQALGFEATVTYSALAPSGAAEIRISGHVTPNAVVHIPGLDQPVVADASGQFSQEVPYAAVKKHASHGRIKATYTHQGKERQVLIDLGS